MRAAALLALLAAACSQGRPPAKSPGQAYFRQVGCASCHRVGDEGSAVGPDLTFVGFRHSARWLDLWLADPQAWKPGTLMPNPRLPEAARREIVAYLSGLRGADAPPGRRPWDAPALRADPVARGKVLYARAGCVGCHGLEGRGGYPNNNVPGGAIPALSKAAEGYSKAELVKRIRHGAPSPMKLDPAGPEPLVVMPSWGEVLDDAELSAAADYILSLAPARGAPADGW